jgi:hypothetical protein
MVAHMQKGGMSHRRRVIARAPNVCGLTVCVVRFKIVAVSRQTVVQEPFRCAFGCSPAWPLAACG